MRKVIDGHRYDTDTARLVGSWESGEDAGDLHYVSETLYRTKAGLYFVHGEGGARSRYAEQVEQNAWGSGSKIVALSPEAAREWAEEHLTGEEYEAEWGTPDEGEGRVMSVRVPEATYQAIRRNATDLGRTMGEVITKAVATCSKDESE